MREMQENVPPVPAQALQKRAPRVTAMRAAGTDLGILFNFGFKDGKQLQMAFNCIVAKEFARAINERGALLDWQQKGAKPAPADHLTSPQPNELGDAVKVVSLATNFTPSGILAAFFAPEFAAGNGTFTLFFPVKAAIEVLASVASAADGAKWWGADFKLLPWSD